MSADADVVSTWFELEELTGGGNWRAVIESMEQSNYESPDRLRFATIGEASAYARRHWSSAAHVRIVEARCARRLVK